MKDLERYRGIVPQPEGSKQIDASTGISLLADSVQGILERAYGLDPRPLRRASEFMWPRATNKHAEKLFRQAAPDHTYYVTDHDFIEYGYIYDKDKPRWMHQPETWQEKFASKYSPRRALFKIGKLPFETIKPVVFFHPSIMNRIGTGDSAQMLDAAHIKDLELVAEQVSHFLYSQSQYRAHNLFAGPIASEMVAILDWYLVLKGASVNPESQTALKDNRPSVESLAKNIDARLNLDPSDFSLNPWTTHFRKGTMLVGGFLGHIIERDKQGENTTPELNWFYRLPPREKLMYLERVYKDHLDKGDDRYEESLWVVKDKLAYEFEFKDPNKPYVL